MSFVCTIVLGLIPSFRFGYLYHSKFEPGGRPQYGLLFIRKFFFFGVVGFETRLPIFKGFLELSQDFVAQTGRCKI